MVNGKLEEADNHKIMMFYLKSLLYVNFYKSRVFVIFKVEEGDSIFNYWGCEEGLFLDVYLVVLFRATFKKREVWFMLFDRFSDNLVLWKHIYLSKGGKLIHI